MRMRFQGHVGFNRVHNLMIRVIVNVCRKTTLALGFPSKSLRISPGTLEESGLQGCVNVERAGPQARCFREAPQHFWARYENNYWGCVSCISSVLSEYRVVWKRRHRGWMEVSGSCSGFGSAFALVAFCWWRGIIVLKVKCLLQSVAWRSDV